MSTATDLCYLTVAPVSELTGQLNDWLTDPMTSHFNLFDRSKYRVQRKACLLYCMGWVPRFASNYNSIVCQNVNHPTQEKVLQDTFCK